MSWLIFFTFISFLLDGVAKREGAEAGGLRAGGSRNAVYGDRVRQKRNEPKKRKLTLPKELLKSLFENFRSQRNRIGTPCETKPNPVPM